MAVINEVRCDLVLPSVSRSPARGADLSFRSNLSGDNSYERLARVDPSGYVACNGVAGSPGQWEDRLGHDTVERLPATVAHSRRAIGARRVPADYRPSTRSRPGRSCACHPGFALVAGIIVLAVFWGIVKAHPGAHPGAGGDPPPVIVDSIEPTEIVQGQVPQPEIQVFGSDFIEGLPSETNRPTVTLRQPGKGGAEFSALAWVNFAGTVATVPPQSMNLLQAPLGVYDVIVTRPTDGASDTLERAFTVTDGQPGPGEIALMVRSAWGGPVNDVEVVGDLAYAAIGRRLVILDVSDAANPFEVGSLNIMAGVEGVAVRDGYAFLGAHKPYEFTVVNVSDPTNPTLVWAGQGDQFSHDVLLYGDFAYVRSTGGHLRLFDITDPLNVVSLGEPLSNAAAIAIVGDLLYVGTSTQCCQAELKIYDLASDPLNPAFLGSLNNVGEMTTALAVEGDFAYWTVRHNGNWFSLEVVDVSIPESPMIVASETGFVWARDVAVADGYAYVADATTNVPNQAVGGWALTKGLAIFDVADPTNPTPIATFKTHGNVTGVEIVGNRAYVHDDGEGLIILDVSDPTNPVRLGNYHSPAVLRQMDKVGDLLYIADAWNGFTVLDVSDAAHPEVVSVYLAEHIEAFDECAGVAYPLGVDAFGIDVQDNRVYLAAGHLGLEVVDASDPASPVFLGALRVDQLPPPSVAASKFVGVRAWDDVASIGFEARTCNFIFGIFLNLDVSDPVNIFELGRISHGPNRASTIEMNSQGIAFIGRGDPELTIDTSDPGTPFVLQFGEIESVSDVALEGDTLLYLVSEENVLDGVSGLYIQDVTDPGSPTLLAHVRGDLGDEVSLNLAYSIAVQDERAYVIGRGCAPLGGCGVQIAYLCDTADPSTPLLLDAVPHVGGTKSAVLVDEPFVYVTNEFEGPNDPGIGLVIMEVVGLNPVGDIDGDGSVGANDLLILLASWGPCPPKGECPADLNDDGSVGAADLLILLANWG